MDRAVESNRILMDAWDVMNRDAPGFEKLRGGVLEASWCGLPSPFFNLVVTARHPESLNEFESSLNDLQHWAAARKVPWILTLGHEMLGDMMPAAERILDAAGFGPMMPLTGMEATVLNPPGRPSPEGAYLTEAHAGVGGKTLRVNEAGYQMKFAEPGAFQMEHAGWWGAPDRMVTLVEVDQVPISCTAVFNVGGVRYVALVATLPSVQRKGYAEAAMRDVLNRSLSAGLHSRTYLHASAVGRPVYERMGYTVTANYTIYAAK